MALAMILASGALLRWGATLSMLTTCNSHLKTHVPSASEAWNKISTSRAISIDLAENPLYAQGTLNFLH